MNKILFFNEDCFKTINNMVEFNQKVDIVLTSPPYNKRLNKWEVGI